MKPPTVFYLLSKTFHFQEQQAKGDDASISKLVESLLDSTMASRGPSPNNFPYDASYFNGGVRLGRRRRGAAKNADPILKAEATRIPFGTGEVRLLGFFEPCAHGASTLIAHL